VVETKIEIEDLENPTVAEEVLLQNNDIALSAIHDAIDERTFEQIKNIEMASATFASSHICLTTLFSVVVEIFYRLFTPSSH
jgi:hypothetical protein